jgi:hypothetical protein
MPVTASLVGGAAILGPVIGGLIGQQQSAADRQAAQAASAAALADINAVGAPPDQAGAILLQHFQSAGLYTPGMENTISAGIAQASQTNTNTVGRQAQVGALGQMQQAANTGYTAVDRAALNNIMQQAGAANQGMQQSAAQTAASQGEGGSGAQLAAQLSSADAAGASASSNSLQQAAQAQQARMAALGQVAQQGSNLNASDFSQAQAKANAADRFTQFDVQNALGVQQQNTSAQNQGQLYNLSNNQQISSANTQLANAETARELAAAQTNWQEQMSQAQAQANAETGNAQANTGYANQIAGQYSGIGSGIGTGVGAAANYGVSAQNANTASTNANTAATNAANSNNYANPGVTSDSISAAGNQFQLPELGDYNGGVIPGYAHGGEIPSQGVHGREVPDHHLTDEQLHAKVKRMLALKKLQELKGQTQNFANGGQAQEAPLYETGGYKKPNPGSNLLAQPQDMSAPSIPIPANQAAIDYAHAKILSDAAAHQAAHPEEYDNYALGGSVNMADQMMGGNLAYGGESPVTALLKTKGGKVPGKAKVKGDSPVNDTVATRLSPQEIVLPRTVVEKGPDAAYGFVHALLKHKDDKK